MTREDELITARQLILRALASAEGTQETTLRQLTNLGISLFHETMTPLLEDGLVVISQGDGRQIPTRYHLVHRQHAETVRQEGPISPLATRLLKHFGNRAEGVRSLAKSLGLEVGAVQAAMDELESRGLVSRRQVGMLVIYRAI